MVIEVDVELTPNTFISCVCGSIISGRRCPCHASLWHSHCGRWRKLKEIAPCTVAAWRPSPSTAPSAERSRYCTANDRNTFTIVSETEVSWEFFGFNIILTHRVFIIVIIHLFIFNKSCEMRRTGWKALVVLFLYSEHPIMLGCLGWSWKWLNALLLCSGTVMIREKWSIRSISTFLSGMQDI